MKFCPTCDSVMTKTTTANGHIMFICQCQQIIEGAPDDTLMMENHLEYTGTDLKHEVFIENSPFDLAGHTVLRDCNRCGLNYMIMIIPGDDQKSMYTCTCGNKTTKDG